MAEKTETDLESLGPREFGAGKVTSEVDAWFEREVLPLEAALMQFLQHNWRNRSDIADLRQDIYVCVYEAACNEIPRIPKAFVFAVARSLLIKRLRREQIIPFEAVSDFDALGAASEIPAQDSAVIARDELRRLQIALDKLPPRCREAFIFRKIDGLSLREISVRMGIAEITVRHHLKEAVRALTDTLYGAPSDLRRPS
jgi:RNA polymerase sigma-70 factor (ECF subfamily)